MRAYLIAMCIALLAIAVLYPMTVPVKVLDPGEDYTRVDLLDVSYLADGGTRVLIGTECERMAMVISNAQGEKMYAAWKGLKADRPLTHDLIKSVLDEESIELLGVKITKLEESTYYAVLVLRESTIKEIDSRPSDAITIAMLYSAPIYASKDVLTDVCEQGVEIPEIVGIEL